MGGECFVLLITCILFTCQFVWAFFIKVHLNVIWFKIIYFYYVGFRFGDNVFQPSMT